jgi:hypothetical protein
MTKEKLINTGRFVDAGRFSILRPEEKLDRYCTDVVLYEDGRYIQLLKSGEYLYDGFRSRDLSETEDSMCKKLGYN